MLTPHSELRGSSAANFVTAYSVGVDSERKTSTHDFHERENCGGGVRKELKTMKYETPELTALTPAINAIQGTKVNSMHPIDTNRNELAFGYEDWE